MKRLRILTVAVLAVAAASCGGGDPQVVPKTAFELEVGDCVRSLGDDEQQEPTLGDVEVITCTEAHRAEVYAVFDYPAGAEEDFPGADTMEEYANEQCRGPVFDSYVGAPYDRSELLVLEATPVESTWSQGDREIVCLAHAGQETLNETINGSER